MYNLSLLYDPAHPDKHSISYLARSALAGGLAGCVAKTAVAPLDRVKILFQTPNPSYQKYTGTWSGPFQASRDIYQSAGIRGLFQGNSATLVRIFPYAATKFMAYDQFHSLLMPTRAHETNARRFIAGALAGMTAVASPTPRPDPHPNGIPYRCTHPTLIRQPSPPNLHRNARFYEAKSMLTRYPGPNFYRGFTVTTLGIIPYAGVLFLTWEYLRSLLPPGREYKSPIVDLAIGAVSGALAQTACYPFGVVRRQMQVGGVSTPGKLIGWKEAVRSVWRGKGWRGFYVGLSIGYAKVVPMSALSFAVWQWAKRGLGV
ncbi:mitochondrial carrier domain-containing protein [Cyathus striatus]|nr:mitochondrial carrier domain-containing protein [Cyathus striatus]